MRQSTRVRAAIALTGLVVAGSATGGEAAPAVTTVAVTVVTDRLEVPDGFYRAAYAIACGRPCPSPRPAPDVDTAGRTIRHAVLGFDAERDSVERTPTAPGVREQDETVVVLVHAPGDLTVTLTAGQRGSVDASPIAGTASAGGSVSGRAVRWRVASARPGRLTFSVRLRVTGDPAKPESYVPRADVSHRVRTRDFLVSTDGVQRAAQPVDRVSTVTLTERLAPAYGPPRSKAGGWYVLTDRYGLPRVLTASASVDAYGAYSAAASGPAGAVSRYDLPRSAVGAFDTASISSSSYGSLLESKAVPFADFHHDGDDTSRLSGLSHGLCVPAPAQYPSLLGLESGGRLYDRDAVEGSAVATFGVARADRKAEPVGRRGTIVPEWPGRTVSNWFGVRARTFGTQPLEGYGLIAGTTISWQVVGGDIDNRTGSDPVRGRAVRIPTPRGQSLGFTFVSTVIPSPMGLRTQSTRSGNDVVVTPYVLPQGYMLRSTLGHPARQDWVTRTDVILVGERVGTSASPLLTTMTLVPPGSSLHAAVLDHTGQIRTRVVGPGLWRLTAGEDVFEVAAVPPSTGSGRCPSLL